MSFETDTFQKEPGDLLLEEGKLSAQQLDQVRRRQARLNLPQHRAITDLNFASEEDTWRALATANRLEFVDPVALDPKREILELVPIKFIFHYHLLPLGIEDDGLILAFSEPPRQMEQGNLRLLLGRQSLFLDLGQLGMEPSQEAVFAQLTQLPQGLVLLTGPTGSGKTTTLYTALAQANDEGRKIITFEDPIEYQLEGTVQIQMRDQIGLTFASGLRSVLRHDPDVVLVGEIRDLETAEIAV